MSQPPYRRPAPPVRPAPPLSGQRLARPTSRRPRRFSRLDERERPRSRPGRPGRARRIASLLLVGLELAALVALLVAPFFHVSRVDVSGNQRMTAAQVVAVAGLQHPGSIFQVDSGQLQRRLTAATWVRAAAVSVELPDRVAIHVDEWQPAAVYRAASGPRWDLSAEAVVLGQADPDDAAALLDIEGPASPEPRPGRAPLDRALLVALVNIQRGLPGLIGQDVQSFTIDSCRNLTLNAKQGWKAQFGRMITPREFATLNDKLAALKALAASGAVDFATVGYVNVMNPAVIAVPDKSRTPRPAPRASPSPSPSPSPGPSGPQVISPCR